MKFIAGFLVGAVGAFVATEHYLDAKIAKGLGVAPASVPIAVAGLKAAGIAESEKTEK